MALTKVTLTGAKNTIKEGWTKFNDLIDDLASTSTGLGASTIGIEDNAGNMTAANVEDALTEIYTDMVGPRALSGGLDTETTTTTGLTWGYKEGKIRDNNNVITVGGSTIALSDDTVNYVEVNASGTVSTNTTGFTPGRIPLRQITTASGIQNISTDKRCWFSTGGITTLTQSRGFPRAQFVWCESLDYDGGTVIFVEGETVTGAGGATGVVEHIVGDATSGTLYLKDRNVTAYVDDEALSGSGSGAATANGASSQNSVVLHPAVYHHSGTSEQIVYWNSKLALEFDVSGADGYLYLYLDDSAIVSNSSPVITSSQLVASGTPPTESFTKFGHYNGNDKVIFAAYNSSNALKQFDHEGDYLSWDQRIPTEGPTSLPATFTDITNALTLPSFSRRAEVRFRLDYSTGAENVHIRKKGSLAANGHYLARLTAGSESASATVFTDSSGYFQIDSSGNGSYYLYEDGWYFPTNV